MTGTRPDGRPVEGQRGPGRTARLLIVVVGAYRRWVSPALPPRCRFHPSCSAYAAEALREHGAARGSALTLRRLLRCQPFHPGGYDPVPPALAAQPVPKG